MQVKIIIGTIAFMLTMIILGFIALREPARLEAFSDARLGRSVENGAEIFVNNCATCHGVNGRAEECFDASSGEQIACAGLPLNNAALLCGTRSQRMLALGWAGGKFDFIQSTVASGRPWNGMPTWGQAFGGPLQNHEVEDVTNFVLNWEDEALCGEEVTGPEWPPMVSELPAGDAENGAQLYEITYGCQACHGNIDEEGSNQVGPWLGDIAEVGPERIDGYTAADYIYESILKPNAFISPECPAGPCTEPSAMPANFGERMSLQDMADMMAYLLGTETFESNVAVEYPEGSVPPPAVEEP
jgi:mono/diheme cytochrome c family protein